MKEKIFNLVIVFISLFVLIQLLIKKSIIYSSIMYALKLWVNNLIPSLFPFFIISDILINYNIINYIPKNIKNICKKAFNITDNMLTILILSMFSGFPTNARVSRSLYDKGCISIDEANHILLFSHFANPIFILTTIGSFFLHNEKIGVIILISHYLSNIILGIIFRSNSKYDENTINKNINKQNFGIVFINAIKKGIDTITLICGIIVIFLMLSTIVVDTFNLDSYSTMIIKGLFEITIGIEALGKLNLNICYKAIIASCLVSFGGISVHVQTISQIIGTNIKYIYFFIGRMYQMILSGLITYIMCILFKI